VVILALEEADADAPKGMTGHCLSSCLFKQTFKNKMNNLWHQTQTTSLDFACSVLFLIAWPVDLRIQRESKTT
jgi:hypothetical protein